MSDLPRPPGCPDRPAATPPPADAAVADAGAAALARIAELERAVQARDDFLAVAAHELRSPLNALALRLALLERQSVRGAPQFAHEIARTRRTVDRYVRRAAVLLDVARLNAGVLQAQPEPVDIARLVTEVVEAWADEATLRGASLAATIARNGTGHWDPHMVEQVLANLVNNALKYGEGSPVHVKAGVEGASAWFEVSDGGPGIADADKARIFEKFERLAGGAHARGGYGLGLWIVGSMVAAHHGSIQIERLEPRGSLFRVKLPLRARRKDTP